ncbi:transposase [Sporolactobacillus nakayamae]|uniref:transposase n=1 Tax=Sporolactobacillus nakayamae TaxID=269670 RepID=UPI003CCB7CCC
MKKRYWGQHLWPKGYFCATVGSVTDETFVIILRTSQIMSGTTCSRLMTEFSQNWRSINECSE